MQEFNLFEHNRTEENSTRRVTKISDEENWQDVRKTLIANTGLNRVPTIHIVDINYDQKHKLFLRHQYDGRELDLSYARRTLVYLHKLWKHPIVLETVLMDKIYHLTFEDNSFSVEEQRNCKKDYIEEEDDPSDTF